MKKWQLSAPWRRSQAHMLKVPPTKFLLWDYVLRNPVKHCNQTVSVQQTKGCVDQNIYLSDNRMLRKEVFKLPKIPSIYAMPFYYMKVTR